MCSVMCVEVERAAGELCPIFIHHLPCNDMSLILFWHNVLVDNTEKSIANGRNVLYSQSYMFYCARTCACIGSTQS